MKDRLPHRRRARLFGLVVPALIYAAGAVVVLAIWGPLPDEVVVHIGPSGTRMGSPVEVLATMGVFGGVGSLVLAGLSLVVGRTSMSRRLVLGIATGWAALTVGMMLAFLLPQTTTAAMSFDGPLGFAFTAAVVAGALAAAGAGDDPRHPTTEPVPGDAPRAPYHPGQAWSRRVQVPARWLAWLIPLGVLYVAGAIALGLASDSWLVPAVLLVPLLVPLTMLRWRVRVDTDGLTASAGLPGTLAWPRQHVPADEVVRADALDVDPLNEFGGWGLRIAPDRSGTVGVVLRKGPAIAVQRTGGRRFVVTVDDAETGAALLNTVADRAREHAGSA